MGDALRYRENAEEWRAMAQKMRRAQDSARFERMAQDWEQLAAEAESRGGKGV
jgi:hypothetical protein